MHSQCGEDKIIAKFFGDHIGTLLDIGANDGITLSNSRYLMEKGWRGVFVEASPNAFRKLQTTYKDNPQATLFGYALGTSNGTVKFHESSSIRIHRNRENVGLISTIHTEWRSRWRPKVASFQEIEVTVKDFASFLVDSPIKQFEFISIDIEGEDINVLRQMDLKGLGCRLLCIEHAGEPQNFSDILSICGTFGMKEIARTKVNSLLA